MRMENRPDNSDNTVNLSALERQETTVEKTATSSPGKKWKKALLLIPQILLYVFLAVCLFLLIVSVLSKKDADGAANLFGYEMRLIVSASMEKGEGSPDVSNYKIKHLKTKSMVFIKRVPEDEKKAQDWYASLKVGDVLTFRYVVGASQETVTHRLIEITPTENGFILRLQGDNRTSNASVATQTVYTSAADYPSQRENYNYIIGKVVGSSTALGYIVYAVKQPVGMALIIIVPCVIIIVWQILRIVSVLSEDRRKKAFDALNEARARAAAEAEEREKQIAELEELRRKFAELEKRQPPGDDSHDG